MLNDELKSTRAYELISSKFKEENDLSRLILPLLIKLESSKSVRDVLESAPHYSDRLSLTEFLNMMVKLGFKSETKRIFLHEIDADKVPCVFIPEEEGAYIISNINIDNVEILDSNTKAYSNEYDLDKKGVIIYFSRLEAESTSVTWFQKILFKYKNLFMQIIGITFVYNMLVVFVPLYVMSIYDKVLPAGSANMLITFTLGILIIVVLMNFLNLFRAKALAYIGARLEKSVGYVVVKDILYLPPGYTENTGVGNQIARIKDFDSIRDFISSPVLITFLEIPTTLIFILIVYILGGALALIPIILAVIFHIMYVIVNPILNEAVRKKAANVSIRQDFLLEALENLKDIKLMGAMGSWMRRLKVMSINIAKDITNISLISVVISELSEMLMLLGGTLIVFFGALLAIDEKISPGGLIAIMLLTWKILNPIKFFFANLPKLQQINNSIKQVNSLMKIKTEECSKDDVMLLERQPAKLEFSRVSFKYHPSLPPALLGISFVINPGEFVCITGSNSSGKTTLLRLILGMYQPQAGSIFINNRNIKQIPPIFLRQNIGYMPQYNKLFYGTIRQNLLFCNPEADDYTIEIATRLANIYDEIMRLPDNFETQVGDQVSQMFSTSFMQRLIFARTFITRSNILLFDEPETSLDAEADTKFIDTIRWKRMANTIIIVSHRPSHLSMADRIINLHEGQIVQMGTPEQVMPHL